MAGRNALPSDAFDNPSGQMMKPTIRLLLVFIPALFSGAIGCDPQSGAESRTVSQPQTSGSLNDKPLATFQSDLLSVAFETASAIPIDPHVKDRSRSQEAVVAACLTLDQPDRALKWIPHIDDWRQGAAYADLALYCAQHDHTEHVQEYLNRASQIAETASDWRRDRIRVKIAVTHAWLGDERKAAEFEAGVTESESHKVDAARAAHISTADFDNQIKVIDATVATGNFDLVRNALESSTRLFDRFYDEEDRRSAVEDKIKSSWKALPTMLRIELMMSMAGFALGHNDQAKALSLVNEAWHMMEADHWTAEDHVALMSRLARLRARTGDRETAHGEADAALSLYEAQRDNIVNIFRAESLRPLAEAYQSMGDSAAALSVYKKAIEEGVVNPNSRPRAQDLCATCCSMAVNALEPDAELWKRIHQIREGLDQPW
jgi:tetratricopeptide (TPR) repeat protein